MKAAFENVIFLRNLFDFSIIFNRPVRKRKVQNISNRLRVLKGLFKGTNLLKTKRASSKNRAEFLEVPPRNHYGTTHVAAGAEQL